MENTANNSTTRMYVKDLGVISGIYVSLEKQDGSEFFDSDVDNLFRKASEYSQCGSNSIERVGSSLMVIFEDPQEGRDFIEGVAYKNHNTNINNNINVIFSKKHDTWGEVSLAKSEGGSFSDLDIQSIFWDAFKYPSLSSFTPYNNKTEVHLNFEDVLEWSEFIRQFDVNKNES